MRLSLSLCTVRSWQPADAPAIVRYANDRELWLNLRDLFPHPYTLGDAEQWIRVASRSVPETHFAIALGDEAIGSIGVELQKDVHRRSAEIGYWLGRPYWGRGIATEAVRALSDYAFATLDVCRLFATVFDWNPASARVLEKAGYVLEGRLRKSVTKNGRTGDSLIFGLVR